jgi:diguanylate cyclase (GGDEF)-like protein
MLSSVAKLSFDLAYSITTFSRVQAYSRARLGACLIVLHLQNIILEMVAKGETLASTADRLCREVERLQPSVVCSVLSVDRSGFVHPLSSPSLPQEYSAALEGFAIGPNAGSCGTAAYLRMPIAVTDIETDVRWANFRHLALPLGFKACWSSPICNGDGEVLGTFAFYYREKRGPTELEKEIVATCVHLCAIAIERHERFTERERQANVDMLTGLGNRACFNRALAALPCAEPGAWALLVVDLDNLKVVNDTFGHHAGDMLLQQVASRIAVIAAPDSAFRLGGDEFAVIVRNPEALRDIDQAAKVLIEEIMIPADCNGHLIQPKATIGGAIVSHDDHVPESVRQNADFALYHAKETGRGGFVRYWPGIGTAITQRLKAIQRVGAALKEDRIDAFYQPIVRLDTREIVGVEALCRLIEDDVVISAVEFQEATSDAHMAFGITELMFSRVARDMRRWEDMGLPLAHISINVSSSDLHYGRLEEQLVTAFQREKITLQHLMLEVTEDVCVSERDQVAAYKIKALREKGLRVALDDFGTGFASLTHLLSFPVDMIKIDKSFVDRLAPGDPSIVIVKGLLDIARQMNISVVAEGVETEAQAAQLRMLGCLFGQGYFYSHAVDRETLTEMLRREAAPGKRMATRASL